MIKFLDLEKINKQHSEELKSAVNQVIDSGWYVLGKEVERFEKQFAKFHHVDYAIACSNGFDALKIILKAYIEIGKLKEGDEVLIPANTFIASALAISEAKLKPVLVEVNPENYLIDYQQIEKHISSKTKAFMNVHLYGQASYSEELREVIQTHNLIHIEDNAQAIAAEVDGIKTGNLGDAAAFSFYPGKNMGALGDAGAILCKDKALAEACRMLSNYGSSKKYVHQSKGHNHRMDELQAAVLNVKLNY
ncbi:MAG: DegT/DnrJ/EryC1/StrS family aminotransferase, partial [Flavobacteriales bacterium]